MMALSAFFLIVLVSLVSRVNRVTEHMKKMLIRSKPGDYAMIAVNKDVRIQASSMVVSVVVGVVVSVVSYSSGCLCLSIRTYIPAGR